MAECAAMLNASGLIVIASFVSPSEDARRQVAERIGIDRYIEVFVDASIDWCRKHDSTGCYEKSERGILHNLAGVDYPYEKPRKPAISIASETDSVNLSVSRILKLMQEKSFLFSPQENR